MEATLQEILDAREQRVQTQTALLSKYQKPLVCLTLNIPGPEKMNRDIAIGFAVGERLLKNSLGGQIIDSRSHMPHTGCEGFYVVNMDARQLKQLTVDLEEIDPIGRLFDLDVIDTDGKKISREALGYPRRKCLLCDKDAAVCASRRAHPLHELQYRTGFLLYIAAREWMCEYISSRAYLALTQEVSTTPKPGLVDRKNAGAHRDMTPRHFFASAAALRPFFSKFAEAGFMTRDNAPGETFAKIRPIGTEAEQAMRKATGGVNTHKGAIFSLGILCAAAGRLGPEGWKTDALLAECAAMAKGVVEKDFAGITAQNAKTAGELLYALHGITGVRGQAEKGFPAVKEAGLPILEKGLKEGLSLNDAGCAALLHLLAAAEDTNLIKRGGLENARAVQAQIKALLTETPFPSKETIWELDREFIENDLSPGGSADLLAITYFLYFLR